MEAQRVTWVYTDGRLPPGREVAAGPAKAHEVLSEGHARIVAGEDVYAAWCEAREVEPVEAEPPAEPEAEAEEEAPGLDLPAADLLLDAGYRSIEDLEGASDEELLAIDGIGPATLADIRAALADVGD